jgi:hypothetical protein
MRGEFCIILWFDDLLYTTTLAPPDLYGFEDVSERRATAASVYARQTEQACFDPTQDTAQVDLQLIGSIPYGVRRRWI